MYLLIQFIFLVIDSQSMKFSQFYLAFLVFTPPLLSTLHFPSKLDDVKVKHPFYICISERLEDCEKLKEVGYAIAVSSICTLRSYRYCLEEHISQFQNPLFQIALRGRDHCHGNYVQGYHRYWSVFISMVQKSYKRALRFLCRESKSLLHFRFGK